MLNFYQINNLNDINFYIHKYFKIFINIFFIFINILNIFIFIFIFIIY